MYSLGPACYKVVLSSPPKNIELFQLENQVENGLIWIKAGRYGQSYYLHKPNYKAPDFFSSMLKIEKVLARILRE